MSNMERITVTLTSEMVAAVRGSVEAGEYTSSSEVIREALQDWKLKKVIQDSRLEELRNEIQAGRSDVKAGRVKEFNVERIIREGRGKLAKHAPSE